MPVYSIYYREILFRSSLPIPYTARALPNVLQAHGMPNNLFQESNTANYFNHFKFKIVCPIFHSILHIKNYVVSEFDLSLVYGLYITHYRPTNPCVVAPGSSMGRKGNSGAFELIKRLACST